MNWSWRIGRIAGIDVYVHFTFLILLGWVGLSHYLAEHSLSQAAAGLGFILALFGIVVLHELGHALAARHYGIQTRDITLLPIGGVARLERIPDDPIQELVVALAGPAVNVVLALALWIGIELGQGLVGYAHVVRVGGSLLDQLLWVNVSLAIFNLIPAFPMDGGRVLRALLALRLGHVQATQTAAKIGQAIALLFGFLGLFFNPFLLFIALFVWMGAAQEASLVQLRAALSGIPIRQAMMTEFQVLAPTDNLSQAATALLSGSQQDFPVLDAGRIVGLLSRNDLLNGLLQGGPETPVGDVMRREFSTADPQEMLEGAFARLNEGEKGDNRVLLVLRGEQLVGLVTSENLSELLMIREALRQAQQRDRRLRMD